MAESKVEKAEEEDRAGTTARPKWAMALVVIGSVIVAVATFTTWVERQALNTDSFVDVTDALLEDDEIREALAAHLVDSLYESVDVDGYIEDLLPQDFDRLSPILASALRGPSVEAVDRLLESDTARQAWSVAARTAHEGLVAVIDDDVNDLVSTNEGRVTLDLKPLVSSLAEAIGLSGDRLDEIPEDAGQVVLFESDELATVQTAAKASKRVGVLLLLAVVASFAVAIWLSPGSRRRTIRNCGWGIIAAAVFVLLARRLGADFLVDRLRRTTEDEPAKSVVEISSSLLRQVALTDLLVGLLIVAFAVAAGPTRPAREIRARLAPILSHGPIVPFIGGFIVFVGFLWLRPGGPIHGGFLSLGMAAACVAGVAWIQNVASRELADDD